MAIAFDATSKASGSGTSLSWSHTCTGSDLILFVSLTWSSTDTPTVTYDGVSMTGITSYSTTYTTAVYYLIAPPTGSHTISITFTNSETSIAGVASSYTSVNQTSPISNSASAENVVSVNVTATLEGSWLLGIGGASLSGGQSWTAGTGFTIRNQQISGSYAVALEDSNGIVSTGSETITINPSIGGGSFFTLGVVFAPAPLPLYWIGGTGNWSDTAHWSESSGGTSAGIIPDSSRTVTFDANSGTGTSTVDSTSNVLDIICTNYTQTLAGSASISVYGSFTLGSSMTNSYTGTLTFAATDGQLITTAGKTINSSIIFNGVGGQWTLQDSFTSTDSITITNGAFTTDGYLSSISSLSNAGTLNLSNETFSLTGTGTVWSNTGTLSAGTSTIKITDASSAAKTFSGGGATYNNLYITGSGTGAYTIDGSNTFNEFKVDTPPHTVNFTAGTTQNIQTFTVNGTAGNLMTLQSTISGSPWFLHKTTSGTVSLDYLSLQDSHAS